MAVSRILMALAAGGVLSASAVADGPRDRRGHSGVSVSIGFGSGHYRSSCDTGFGRSGFGHYRGSSFGHYRGSSFGYSGTSHFGTSHYGSSHYRGGSHYYHGHSDRGYYRSPVRKHVTVIETCPPPVVYAPSVYKETYVYRRPAHEPARVVKVYDGYDRYDRYSAATIEEAWEQLARGDRRALTSFSSLAEGSPYKALPKVGYALACAERGDLDGAIVAMRRAFEADADGIHYFPRDERLLSLVQTLEYRYIDRAEREPANASYHFMVGALAFLRHDMERARVATAKAEDYRDYTPSLRELRRVVEKYHEDYSGEG